jgi:hypothetical protein
VVDVLNHDDGGVVTLLLLLSVMVRRCGDGLEDEHLVLENTLLCKTLTSNLFRVLKIEKECGKFLFLKLIQNSETENLRQELNARPFQNEKPKKKRVVATRRVSMPSRANTPKNF